MRYTNVRSKRRPRPSSKGCNPNTPELRKCPCRRRHLPFHFFQQRNVMSAAAKVTFATTTLSAIGIVVFVHRQQKTDQAVSRALVQGEDTSADLNIRPCIKELYVTWSNNASRKNANWISTCNGNWKRNTDRSKTSAIMPLEARAVEREGRSHWKPCKPSWRPGNPKAVVI